MALTEGITWIADIFQNTSVFGRFGILNILLSMVSMALILDSYNDYQSDNAVPKPESDRIDTFADDGDDGGGR